MSELLRSDDYEEFNKTARDEIHKIREKTTIFSKLLSAISFCASSESTELLTLNSKLRKFDGDISSLYEDINKEFKIACMGLEKAGKSSLLNAWLEFDLLPTDIRRCTNTITEVKSCDSEEAQRYKIEYYTKNEFIQYKEQLAGEIAKIREAFDLNSREAQGNSELNILEDELSEITKHETEIMRNIELNSSGCKQGPLNSEDMHNRDLLKQAITNPAHARAVKRVTVWSNKLLNKRNIVLLDLPGYNSPLKNHKDQTKKIISEVDAILFVKTYGGNTNIELSENDIIRLIDNRRFNLLSSKERFIVALTQFDRCTSKIHFQDLRKNAELQWSQHGIDANRIVNCCSYVRLKSSFDKNADKGTLQEAQRKVKDLCGGSDGIDELKAKVDDLIISKYRRAIKIRYDELRIKFSLLQESILNYGKNNFTNEGISDSSNNTQSIKEEILNKWWAEQWQTIQENFKLFFISDVFPRKSPDDLASKNKYLKDFRNKYIEIVDRISSNIQAIKSDRMGIVYSSVAFRGGITSVEEGHESIRKELNYHMYKGMTDLANELAEILVIALNEILEWIHQNMWGIEKIKDSLLEMPLNVKKKTYADRFETLILRLARPANDLFLRYPRFSTRKKVLQHYYREVTLLDLFYHPDGTYDEKSHHSEYNKTLRLPAFLAKGNDLQTDYKTDYTDLRFDINALEFSENCESFEEVAKECTEDFEEFTKYLKHSIYYASGIESLFEQELDKIVSKFEELEKHERKWQHLVFDSIRKGNDYLICPSLIEKLDKRDFILTTLKKIEKNELGEEVETDESGEIELE